MLALTKMKREGLCGRSCGISGASKLGRLSLQPWEGSFHPNPATDLSVQLTGPATRAVTALNYSGASRPLPHLFLSLCIPDCQRRPQSLCQGAADLRALGTAACSAGAVTAVGWDGGNGAGVREGEHGCEHGCGNVAVPVKRDCLYGRVTRARVRVICGWHACNCE